MPLFWKPYKSDISKLLDSLKAQNPRLEEDQRAGRALLWDRSIDRTALAEYQESSVPQPPYVYQTKSH
jgi:hypothetical protein